MSGKGREVVLEELMDDAKKLKKITSLLDNELSDVKNWKGLLEKLHKNKVVEKKNYLKHQKNKYGGGSPGKVLLEKLALENQETTIKDFIDKAGKLQRGDIKGFLEKIVKKSKNPLKLLMNLSIKQQSDLGDLLNKNLEGSVADYKDFASSYGYGHVDIENMKSHQKKPNEWSATKGVLQYVMQQRPNYPLSSLVNILEEMGRRDVKKEVETFIEKAAKKPREYVNSQLSENVQEDYSPQSHTHDAAKPFNHLYSVVAVVVVVTAVAAYLLLNKVSNIDSDAYIVVKGLVTIAAIGLVVAILEYLVQKFDEFLNNK